MFYLWYYLKFEVFGAIDPLNDPYLMGGHLRATALLPTVSFSSGTTNKMTWRFFNQVGNIVFF